MDASNMAVACCDQIHAVDLPRGILSHKNPCCFGGVDISFCGGALAGGTVVGGDLLLPPVVDSPPEGMPADDDDEA